MGLSSRAGEKEERKRGTTGRAGNDLRKAAGAKSRHSCPTCAPTIGESGRQTVNCRLKIETKPSGRCSETCRVAIRLTATNCRPLRLSTANAASLKNGAYARYRIFAWTAAVDEAVKVASRRSYFPVRLRSRRAQIVSMHRVSDAKLAYSAQDVPGWPSAILLWHIANFTVITRLGLLGHSVI